MVKLCCLSSQGPAAHHSLHGTPPTLPHATGKASPAHLPTESSPSPSLTSSSISLLSLLSFPPSPLSNSSISPLQTSLVPSLPPLALSLPLSSLISLPTLFQVLFPLLLALFLLFSSSFSTPIVSLVLSLLPSPNSPLFKSSAFRTINLMGPSLPNLAHCSLSNSSALVATLS